MSIYVIHYMTSMVTRWSEFLESVTKDVECFFEILKERLRILNNGLQLHTKSAAEILAKTITLSDVLG